MKLSNERRTPQKVPVITLNEHLQRVEEWTQKAHPSPPPNYVNRTIPAADQIDNRDLEAQSELIVEGVRLLDSRDEQIASTPSTAEREKEQTASVSNVEESNSLQDQGLGKLFRESKLTAKNYVKEFEYKVNQKKAFQSAIFNAYPHLKHLKGLKTKKDPNPMSSTHAIPSNTTAAGPEEDPTESWRVKTTRSVRFAMKYPGHEEKDMFARKDSEHSDLPDETWTVDKHENDRDWWKWKLKQRVLENDELLQKLVAQRHRIEDTFLFTGTGTSKGKSRKDLTFPSTITQSLSAFSADASRHVAVEFQSPKSKHPVGASTSSKKDPTSSSKQLLDDVITTTKITHASKRDAALYVDDSEIKGQSLKPLKKDPYLAKILAGKEMFKPEIMLEAAQPSRGSLTQQHHHRHHHPKPSGRYLRRKISLESLSDSIEDEIAASEYFHPDVKVLYERFSEIDATAKSKVPVAENFSREPSDGFVNLPILLATGRFNRYDRLPSMKDVAKTPKAKKESGKSASDKLNSKLDKSISIQMKKDTFKGSKMIGDGGNTTGKAFGGPAQPTKIILGGSKAFAKNKTENISTKDWANRLMQRMKQQQSPGSSNYKTEEDVKLSEDDDDITDDVVGAYNDIHFNTQQHVKAADNLGNIQAPKKYHVPIDQETNLLYHEILMSKWKKDKHERGDKDNTGVGITGAAAEDSLDLPLPNTLTPSTPTKKGLIKNQQQQKKKTFESRQQQLQHHHHHHNKDKKGNNKEMATTTTEAENTNKNATAAVSIAGNNNVTRTRPKGLDIWLENLRERAKRDRLISPALPGAEEKIVDGKTKTFAGKGKEIKPSVVTTFENTAFNLN